MILLMTLPLLHHTCWALKRKQLTEICNIWIEKQFQKSPTNPILAGLKKEVSSAGEKSCCGFIAIFNYLSVPERIFFLFEKQI
jgi:hypothetical protein